MSSSERRAPPLCVRGLVVRARDGRTLLTIEALDVAPGERIGLRGPSGAGKSTLLHALSGMAAAAGGSVRWGGDDLACMGEAARDAFRRRMIGMVFQDALLFEELSPLDNAAIAAAYVPRAERAAIRARAARALSALGAPSDGRAAAMLSGGERQRVAMARALACDPPILLADEPTASLDRAAADALIAALQTAAAGGRTLIAASHDPALLAAMDRVIELRDGAPAADVAAAAPALRAVRA